MDAFFAQMEAKHGALSADEIKILRARLEDAVEVKKPSPLKINFIESKTSPCVLFPIYQRLRRTFAADAIRQTTGENYEEEQALSQLIKTEEFESAKSIEFAEYKAKRTEELERLRKENTELTTQIRAIVSNPQEMTLYQVVTGLQRELDGVRAQVAAKQASIEEIKRRGVM